MESQQMMELLLKEIRVGQEQMVANMDVDRKTDKEEVEANGKTDKEDFMAILDAKREKADAD
jgi:hypothetical protein